MEKNNPDLAFNEIVDLLRNKSSLKLDVLENAKQVFKLFKNESELLASALQKKIKEFDSRLTIEFKEKGDYYFELKIAGDLLVFTLHSNIFQFEKNHYLWQSKYIKENPNAIFCGQISVYNFLADSMKFNRQNDIGYPIARFFINKDRHYFAEGKGSINLKHGNFSSQVIKEEIIRLIIESLILYCMDFDLYVPPFQSLQELSVSEVTQTNDFMSSKTGKRLGFKFQFEDEKK